jgi:hypothetical protein
MNLLALPYQAYMHKPFIYSESLRRHNVQPYHGRIEHLLFRRQEEQASVGFRADTWKGSYTCCQLEAHEMTGEDGSHYQDAEMLRVTVSALR